MSATTGDSTRPRDPLAYERGFWGRGLSRVAGVDEVGRGPLAGPVVAAAVVLPPDRCIDGVADSKVVDEKTREELYSTILREASVVAIGAASTREIDRINILKATTRAMRRALGRIAPGPDHVVVDGLFVQHLGYDHDPVVGGDGRVHSIACASIVAKVVRDRLMVRLAARYPGYGWERNKGYGTAEHLEAIERLGATPHHRRSFLGVQHELEL